MTRKINILFVPSFGISDSLNGYRRIEFPEIETDEESLLRINNVEITNRVGMPNDLLRHTNESHLKYIFDEVIETIYAPSFMCALTWYNKLTQ